MESSVSMLYNPFIPMDSFLLWVSAARLYLGEDSEVLNRGGLNKLKGFVDKGNFEGLGSWVQTLVLSAESVSLNSYPSIIRLSKDYYRDSMNLACKTIRVREVLFGMVMEACDKKVSWFDISAAELARQIGYKSTINIYEALNELAEAQYIEKRRTSSKGVSYWFNPFKWFKLKDFNNNYNFTKCFEKEIKKYHINSYKYLIYL